MRKVYLVAVMAMSSTMILAQDPTIKNIQSTAQTKTAEDTSHKSGWKKGGVFSLNLAQGSSSNWAAGSEKFSFATSAVLNVFANKKSGKWSWDNSLNLSYAVVNTTSLGVRKNDDKIDFLTKAGYALGPKLDVSFVGAFRSQFTDGFEYDYFGKGLKHRISGLFAPAYVTAAPGITWKPTSYFNVFISPIAGRWVIVSNDPYSFVSPTGVLPTGEVEVPLAKLYGVDPRQKVKIELGAFISANFNKDIAKNVNYASRLDLYSNYLKTKRAGDVGDGKARPQNIDVYWTNTLTMKVNKWLNVTYQLDVIYDDDVRQFGDKKTSAGTQVRSLLGVGFSAKF
jgi:hypothetical protein